MGADTGRRQNTALMGLAMIAMLAAVWAGLQRMGWVLPAWRSGVAIDHGALMISGFFGTLIGLERAIGLGKRWAYIATALAGVGGMLLVLGAPAVAVKWLFVLSGAGLVAIHVVIVRVQPALFTAVLLLGALSWLVGNAFWLVGWPTYGLLLWWMGFLVLFIVGERLELSRVRLLSTGAQIAFAAATLVFVTGQVVASLSPDWGTRLAGVGLLALAVWLLCYDIARFTVRQTGLIRFIAISLLTGFIWLGAGGLIFMVYGQTRFGFVYDAALHTVFLGFVFSMIFAHAPIIIPAVIKRKIPYRPAFYTHLFLLHASLCLRIAGDLAAWPLGRQWGGMLNALAVLLFGLNTAVALRSGRSGR